MDMYDLNGLILLNNTVILNLIQDPFAEGYARAMDPGSRDCAAMPHLRFWSFWAKRRI